MGLLESAFTLSWRFAHVGHFTAAQTYNFARSAGAHSVLSLARASGTVRAMFARLRGSLLLKGSLAVAGCAALMPQHAHSAGVPEALILPQVGLGLWKSKPGEVGEAVKTALRSGYQLLDGAAAYSNEHEVGEALAECIAQGIVVRDDVVVVSKLFNTHHVWQGDRSRPAAALAKTLADLQLEYLDVYLMHWPLAFEQTDMAAIGGLRL